MAQHLPYLNAVYFGANTFIDNFRIYALLTLAWLGIWAVTFGLGLIALFAFPHLSTPHANSVMPAYQSSGMSIFSFPERSALVLILPGIALFALGLFYNLIYQYQLVRLAMALYKNITLELTDLLAVNEREFYLFAASRLLLALKFIFGLLALIVPGFYLATKYFFAGFSLVEKTSSTIPEDTSFSAQLTDGLIWPMLFVLCMHGIAFTGFLPFWPITLICWTFYRPIATLAEVHLYHTLKSTHGAQRDS